MSWIDSLLRPVFSRDLQSIQEGKCSGGELLDLLGKYNGRALRSSREPNFLERCVTRIFEKYNDTVSPIRHSPEVLARDKIASAALKLINGKRAIIDHDDRKCLELIAESPPSRRGVFLELKDRVMKQQDVESASLFGQLAIPSDFHAGVFEGVQTNLLLRYAQLCYALQYQNDEGLDVVLTCLADKLDNETAVGDDARSAILNKLVCSTSHRLDPNAAFRIFCALETPDAAREAATLFLRHPEQLSSILHYRVRQEGKQKDLLMEGITSAFKQQIREGGEDDLRESLRRGGCRHDEFIDLSRIFERCVEAVEEEASSFGPYDVQIFPSWNFD